MYFVCMCMCFVCVCMCLHMVECTLCVCVSVCLCFVFTNIQIFTDYKYLQIYRYTNIYLLNTLFSMLYIQIHSSFSSFFLIYRTHQLAKFFVLPSLFLLTFYGWSLTTIYIKPFGISSPPFFSLSVLSCKFSSP